MQIKLVNRRAVLDLVTSVVLLVAAAAVLWGEAARRKGGPTSAGPALAVPEEPFDIGRRTSYGDPKAETVLVEFADVECTFCRSFARERFPEIDQRYISTGKMAFELVHLPLSIHKFAVRAAHSLECADDQGDLWPFLDALYQIPIDQLSDQSVRQAAEELKLDLKVFDECVKSPLPDRIEQDRRLAAALNITATPVFIVGKRMPDGRIRASDVISGVRPTEEFRRILDAATGR